MRLKKTGAVFRPAGSSSDEDDAFGFGDVYEKRSRPTFHNTPREKTVDYFEEFSRETLKGNLQGVEEAITHLGPDVPSKIDLAISGGWNALTNACHLGYGGVVEFLLKKGADPHIHNHELFTPLMAACSSYCTNENDILQCIKLLIKNEVNVDDADTRGITALMCACKSGHVSVVQALVDNNANLNLQDSQGWTALFWAVDNGNFSIVEVLVKSGAKKKRKDFRGRTAFQVACGRGDRTQIVDILCPRKLRGEFINEPENEDSDIDEVGLAVETISFDFVHTEMPKLEAIGISSRNVTKEIHLRQSLDLTTFLTITDEELLTLGVKYPWHRRQTLEYIKCLHLQPWKKLECKTLKNKKVESVKITYATATKYMLELCTRLSHIQASIAYLSHQCPLERMCGTEKAQRTFRPKALVLAALSKQQINEINDLLKKFITDVGNTADEEIVSPADLLTNDKPQNLTTMYSHSLISFIATCTVVALVTWKNKDWMTSKLLDLSKMLSVWMYK